MSENRLKEIINEINTNRENSKELLNELKKARKHMSTLIPENTDFKSRFLLEGKLKALTALINTESSLIKQIDDSYKTEFELMKKIESEDVENKNISITMIAKALEENRKQHNVERTN
jgi:hypothetical protein